MKKIKEEIRKYLETDESGNRTLQSLWYAARVVLRGKFIAIQAFLRKQGKSQINNLTYHLKELDKEQRKPKVFLSLAKVFYLLHFMLNVDNVCLKLFWVYCRSFPYWIRASIKAGCDLRDHFWYSLESWIKSYFSYRIRALHFLKTMFMSIRVFRKKLILSLLIAIEHLFGIY